MVLNMQIWTVSPTFGSNATLNNMKSFPTENMVSVDMLLLYLFQVIATILSIHGVGIRIQMILTVSIIAQVVTHVYTLKHKHLFNESKR